MERIAIQKSRPMAGSRPDWYRGHKTHDFGNYFGTVASFFPNETYSTHDKKYIVHKDQSGAVNVFRNVCPHAGAPLIDTPGAHDLKAFLCSVHNWTFRLTGEIIDAPHFRNCEHIRLQSAPFGVWNGYILGYPAEELETAFADFGKKVGITKQSINPAEFSFISEEVFPCPYPRELMLINYFDGLHVPLRHKLTFDAVLDCGTYQWELYEDHANVRPWYSLQLVRARKDVRRHMERLMRLNDCDAEALGWASLHEWLRSELPDVKRPLSEDIFAVWGAFYGNGCLMPELYEGGLFLAVSSLLNKDPGNPETGNLNLVEYYVHKSIPESYREAAAHKFRTAYVQSAKEDNVICLELWDAHQRGSIEFDRVLHQELEAGDAHWRDWFMKRFVKK